MNILEKEIIEEIEKEIIELKKKYKSKFLTLKIISKMTNLNYSTIQRFFSKNQKNRTYENYKKIKSSIDNSTDIY